MRLVFLTGDGIGPEISAATLRLMEHVKSNRQLNYEISVREVGLETLRRHGTTLPRQVFQEVKNSNGFILAPLSTYQYPSLSDGGINPSSEFRTKLDLYANIRPCKQFGSHSNEKSSIDLIIVRENTEGFYACRTMFQGAGEFMPDPESAFAIRKISRLASEKIARTAFSVAAARKAKKVTTIHKANVLKMSDGLFLEVVRKVASEFPEVVHDEMLVDAAAALLVRNPAQFDVVLTTNLFGDILSNQAAEIAGGLGLSSSLNAGFQNAMAQAGHGSAPDIAGKNIANPTGLMMSVAMLFDWLGRKHKIKAMENASSDMVMAIERTLASKESRTRDIGGNLSTQEFTDKVIKNFPTT